MLVRGLVRLDPVSSSLKGPSVVACGGEIRVNEDVRFWPSRELSASAVLVCVPRVPSLKTAAALAERTGYLVAAFDGGARSSFKFAAALADRKICLLDMEEGMLFSLETLE